MTDVGVRGRDDLVVGIVDPRDMIFAVVAMEAESGYSLARPMVFGTAFCLGPGVFVTAAHVLDEIRAISAFPALAIMQDRQVVPVRALDHECIPSHDVGVMLCPVRGALGLLHWAEGPASMTHDVSALGFPYSVDWDQELGSWKFAMRGFKGSIITRRRMWRFSGRPLGYEVDCAFHPGMSGAPLLNAAGTIPELTLIGMVLGEQETTFAGRVIRFGEALDVWSLAEVRSTIVASVLRQMGAIEDEGPRTFGELRVAVLARGQTR